MVRRIGFLALLVGCNGILGIEEPTLDEPSASSDGGGSPNDASANDASANDADASDAGFDAVAADAGTSVIIDPGFEQSCTSDLWVGNEAEPTWSDANPHAGKRSCMICGTGGSSWGWGIHIGADRLVKGQRYHVSASFRLPDTGAAPPGAKVTLLAAVVEGEFSTDAITSERPNASVSPLTNAWVEKSFDIGFDPPADAGADTYLVVAATTTNAGGCFQLDDFSVVPTQ